MLPVPWVLIVDVAKEIVHIVRLEDMPPARFHTGELVAPGRTLCGANFWWDRNHPVVSLPINTTSFLGDIVSRGGSTSNCMACLAEDE